MELEKRVKELYYYQYFEKVKIKKIITMFKVIVIDKERDLSIIAEKSGMTLKTLKKYLNDKDLLLEFLTNYQYEEFLLILKDIEEKEVTREQDKKYDLVKNIINEILTTRYAHSDIARHNYINVENFNKILNDTEYIKENFGEETLTKVKFRLNETNIIRISTPRDKHVVEDANLLRVLNPKIKYVDDVQLKIIKVTSEYLLSGANLELVKEKMEMPIQSIFNYVSDSRVKELLKPEHYNTLTRYLNLEKIMIENDFNVKRDLILDLYEILKQNNYDFQMTCIQKKLPYNLLKRILSNPFTGFVINQPEELNKIKECFTTDNKKITNKETDIKSRKR